MSLWCNKFKLFGYFRHGRLGWYWLTHDGTGSPSWRTKQLYWTWDIAHHDIPGVSLKVRLCSPLVAGYTLLVGASFDYPNSFV